MPAFRAASPLTLPPGTPDPARRGGLAASAERLQGDTADLVARDRRRTRLPWQTRAFAYYELLGEVWYAAQFYARLGKLELKLAKQVGPEEWEVVEDPNLTAYVDRIQDPGGGRTNLLSTYGRLKFLSGETYLLVTPDEEVPNGERWEMLSCDELRWFADDNSYKRYRLPNTQPETYAETPAGEWEPLPGEAIAYRLWTRHPVYSALADAPMRGILDLCEELVILTRAVRARGRSRLTGSGLLLVPDEIDFPENDQARPDEDPQASWFMAQLTAAMTAGIADEGAASAVVPIVLRVNSQFIDKFQHMQFFDPSQVYPETGLRSECIQRMAIGVDMPPEILLGKSGANHWSAWQVDEESWTAHLQPKAQELCDELTGAYLRPSMRADNVADWDSYAIIYDASQIIQHPDRGRDAKDAWDRGAINWEALRDALGFDDTDAMDEEEYAQWVGIKLGDAGMAVTGVPTPAPEPTPPPVAAAPPDNGDEEDPSSAPGQAPDDPQDDSDPAEEPVAEVGSIPTPIMLAQELIAERARELAGSRLRSRLVRQRDAMQILDGIPNRDVGAVLFSRYGGDMAPLLEARHALVSGGGEVFRCRLESWGLSPDDVDMVIATAEAHAAETLFDAVHA